MLRPLDELPVLCLCLLKCNIRTLLTFHVYSTIYQKYPGRPFKPGLAQPVDMFPLTSHCEMVMTFDRMSEEEYAQYHDKE
jgi:hypothetical protein